MYSCNECTAETADSDLAWFFDTDNAWHILMELSYDYGVLDAEKQLKYQECWNSGTIEDLLAIIVKNKKEHQNLTKIFPEAYMSAYDNAEDLFWCDQGEEENIMFLIAMAIECALDLPYDTWKHMRTFLTSFIRDIQKDEDCKNADLLPNFRYLLSKLDETYGTE